MENTYVQQVDPQVEATPGHEILWKRLLGTGIFMFILGSAAVLLPFVATLTIEVILAAILIIAGFTHFVHAFQSSQPKGFVLRLLVAGLYILVGMILLFYPLKGALTLTVLLALLLMVAGSVKIAHALAIRPFQSWLWLIFSGILSFLLGLVIWLALPQAANWTIGLLIGIELVFSGCAMVVYAISIKKYNITSTFFKKIRK